MDLYELLNNGTNDWKVTGKCEVVDTKLINCNFDFGEGGLIIPEGVEEIDCLVKHIDSDGRVKLPKSLKKLDAYNFCTFGDIKLFFPTGCVITLKNSRTVNEWGPIHDSYDAYDANNARNEEFNSLTKGQFKSLDYGINISKNISVDVSVSDRNFDGDLSNLLSCQTPLLGLLTFLEKYKNNDKYADIIIMYNDYHDLVKILNEEIDEILSIVLGNLDFRVSLVGPHISFFQQDKIISKLKKKYRYIQWHFYFNDDPKKNIVADKLDSETKTLILEIINFSAKLPNEARIEVLNKVNKLITKYFEDVKLAKPQYAQSITNLNVKDASFLKCELLLGLLRVKFSLTEEEKMTDYLDEISRCEKIIENGAKDLANDESLEDSVNNIMYFLNSIGGKIKEDTLSKLKDMLKQKSSEITSQLTARTNGEIVLEISETSMDQLKKQVLVMLDEIEGLCNIIVPYKELLNAINNSEIISLDNEDTIISDINKARYVLSKISDDVKKEKLSKKLDELFDKYRNLINNILNDKNELSKKKYDDFELEFRKEFQSFLLVLRNYTYLDSIEKTKKASGHNKDDLVSQLTMAIDIIKNNNFAINLENYDDEIIVSFAIEVCNDILRSEYITLEDKKNIIADLLSTLEECLNVVSNTSIKSLNEYNKSLKNVMGEIAKVKINTLEYNYKMKNYKKAINI